LYPPSLRSDVLVLTGQHLGPLVAPFAAGPAAAEGTAAAALAAGATADVGEGDEEPAENEFSQQVQEVAADGVETIEGRGAAAYRAAVAREGEKRVREGRVGVSTNKGLLKGQGWGL